MTTLKNALKKQLTEKQLALVPSSYDIVGDILIFADFPKELKNKEKLIGNTLLKLHKNLKVICKKTKKYSGKFVAFFRGDIISIGKSFREAQKKAFEEIGDHSKIAIGYIPTGTFIL